MIRVEWLSTGFDKVGLESVNSGPCWGDVGETKWGPSKGWLLDGHGFDGVVVDLTDGAVSGDSLDPNLIGLLRQQYVEQLHRVEAASQGITIEGRRVDRDGAVYLMCRLPR